MDFLLEMTPGTGWLARENDRVVFLPHAETVDVAHDVIEPLLVPRQSSEAFAALQSWVESSRPLPPVLLVALDSSVSVFGHGVAAIDVGRPSTSEEASIELGKQLHPLVLDDAASLSLGTADGEAASGMLVEGVIRAGGFTMHMHTNASARTSQEVARNPTPTVMQLHLDEYSVEVGDGIVVGRWPYKHASFNPGLEPLILADPAVSRLHAEVVPTGAGATVTDRNSHNGTWVVDADTGDRQKLTPDVPQTIRDGDKILLGDTVIRFGGST